MADRLFGIPFSRWADKFVAPYVDQIKQVRKDRLTDETINDLINRAVNNEKLIAPILDREKTHAKRLDTQYLAVHVPVSINIELLHIEPTEFIIPSTSAYTQKDELVITLRDDDRLESELDSFLGEVRNNLVYLDRDLGRLKMRLNESIMTIARSRRTEIEEMAARDRTRSFPVR